MTKKRFKRFCIADGFKIVAIKDNDKIMNSKQVCNKLNELAEENEELKCALGLVSVDYIDINDKIIDIPPYYEFENYQNYKIAYRDNYDEYW